MKSIDINSLKPFYADAAPRNAIATLPDKPRRYVRKAEHRTVVDARKVSAATDLLSRLPEARESIHAVMRGSFDSWALVQAIARLALPAKIQRIDIASLGINWPTARSLVRMLDSGEIQQIGIFILSHYFRAHATKGADGDRGLWEYCYDELRKRGGTVAAARSHAKIIGIEATDGSAFTIESSANLRSCKNAEQFCLTHDAKLLAFHRKWMTEMAKEAS